MDITAQIDAFFAGKTQQWALFDALMTAVLAAYPDTKLRVMKTCISFDDPRPYLYVSFPRKKGEEGLLVTLSLRERVDHSRFSVVVPVSKNRFTVHIPLRDAAEIDAQLLDGLSIPVVDKQKKICYNPSVCEAAGRPRAERCEESPSCAGQSAG